ncbi:uncharacterized protein LOC131955125 [Physella acuta]|uniref:uncharacterized protein LOC131955125 n=1 Tax=Physella acuta TaxID=109671 RepID=UPI0027DBBFAA|nr:uncharacterized protein LOC131955125 [Physella acuta]
MQINSSTQGCGENEKAGMLIGNVFIIYSPQCSTLSSPTMANLSNLDERQLVMYIRNTCNGLSSCLLVKENLQLKTTCGNFCTCLVMYYDIYYSCYPVVPDNKKTFDMSKDFNTTFDTHTADINVYLVLQRQHLVYNRTCCVEANGISINVRFMNMPSALTVQFNGATEILDDRLYNLSKRFFDVVKLCFTQKTLMEPLWFHLTDASANQIFRISCRGEKSNITGTDIEDYSGTFIRIAVSLIIGLLFFACLVLVFHKQICKRRCDIVESMHSYDLHYNSANWTDTTHEDEHLYGQVISVAGAPGDDTSNYTELTE